MWESLWRWAWAWVCLAAAGQGQCEGQDLSLQPSVHPLPADVTVTPLAAGWSLNLTLQNRGAPPAACVRLKNNLDKRNVQVLLLKGDCVHGDTKDYNYLPGDSVTLGATTTLAVVVKGSDVFVIVSNYGTKLMADNWSLPRDYLQVVMEQDVQAAVVSHVNCSLYKHSFQASSEWKKVMEWHHNKLRFYYRPWTPFIDESVKLVCMTGQGKEVRGRFSFHAVKEAVAGPWTLVVFEQHGSKVTAQVNRGKVQEFPLLDSCTFIRYDILVNGDASFGFDCKPEHVVEEERRPVTVPVVTPDPLMHTVLAAGVGMVALLVLQALVFTIYSCRPRRKKIN